MQKILSRSAICVQGERQKYIPPFPPLFKDEGLRDIRHSMSIGNLILGVTSVAVSYLIMTIYYKMRHTLLQNVRAILLQNATEVYYKMRQVFHYKMRQFYYKMRQFYYKMQQLLKNATFITNYVSKQLLKDSVYPSVIERRHQSPIPQKFKMEGVAILFKGYKPLIIAVLATPLLSEVNANKWRKNSSDSYLQY